MNRAGGLKGCRVLIVEDEYFFANDLEKALEAYGAVVVGPFADFEETRDQVRRDGFDVAILDINLHDEMAYPIADELILRNVPFAFYSGYDKDVIPERFAHVRLWQKPDDPRELIQHIGELCQSGSIAE